MYIGVLERSVTLLAARLHVAVISLCDSFEVDAYIVTTNWETPTPHGSYSNLYVRTNNTDNNTDNETTWVNYSSGQYWQATGAKGTEDRGLHSNVRTVNYSEVGTWLSFDVTDLAQQGVYEFLLFGSYAGVNKDIQFPSNEYWDAFKRPKLTITYTS